jgi:hypothetical protein
MLFLDELLRLFEERGPVQQFAEERSAGDEPLLRLSLAPPTAEMPRLRSLRQRLSTGAIGHFRSDGVTAQFSGNRTLDSDNH